METLYLPQEVINYLVEIRKSVININKSISTFTDEGQILIDTLNGLSKKGKTLIVYPFKNSLDEEMMNWQSYIEGLLECADIIYLKRNNQTNDNLSLIKEMNDSLELLIKNLKSLKSYLNKSKELKEIFSKPIKISISEEIDSVFTKSFTTIINDITKFKEVYIEEIKENLGEYYFNKLTK